MYVDGRVRRAERKRKERREHVLSEAARVFADKGYHATSITDIIEAAGIARGTFYLYFPSKKALFDALLDDFFERLTREVRPVDVTPGSRPPSEQLHSTIRDILQTLVDHRELTRIVLHGATGLDPDFDRKLHDFYDRILRVVQHALETGQKLGLLRPCDTAITSYCILGSVKELCYQLLVLRAQDLDLDLVVREVLAFNTSGLFQRR